MHSAPHTSDCPACLAAAATRERCEAEVRTRQAARTQRLRSRPRWLDRAALGHYSVAGVDAATKREVRERREQIEGLRYQRRSARRVGARGRRGRRETIYRGIQLVVRWDISARHKIEWAPRPARNDMWICDWFPSRRAAARVALARREWRVPGGTLLRYRGRYSLHVGYRAREWDRRPMRHELIAAIIALGNADAPRQVSHV